MKKELSFASYIRLLKKHTQNPQLTDEKLVNEVVGALIEPAGIFRKDGEEYYLDKTAVSQLLNHKRNVPKVLSDVRITASLKEKVVEGLSYSIKNRFHLDEEAFRKELMEAFDLGTNVDRYSDCSIQELVTECFLASLTRNNLADDESIILWQNNRNRVMLTKGNLFSFAAGNRKKNIVVIPVDTMFHTHVTSDLEVESYPAVSANTIHGTWLKKMKEEGIDEEELDTRIQANLSLRSAKIIDTAIGEKPIYPIGTLSIFESAKAYYFLLAISQFDEKNVARSSADDIKEAITHLLVAYDESGQGYDMYVPLLGTGRSRTGLTNKTALDLLVSCFKKNSQHIQGSITVVVQPTAWDEIIENCQEEK